MALSEDQKAMLRLLAQREEGYADIAALKGMSIDEVRAEVREALAELQADGKAPAPSPPAATAPAEPAEGPTGPAVPPAPAESRLASPTPPRRPGGRAGMARPRIAVPPERRRLLALTGAAIVIVAIALIAFAVLGNDSSSSRTAESEAAEGAGTGLTQATLKPADGGEATGRAIFGRVGQKEVALQVTAKGLAPSGHGESYTVWLYSKPKLALRVGSVKVPSSGGLAARFPIPTELLAYVASGAFKKIYVSRTSDAAYNAEVKQAKQNKALPPYTGETVLRGTITGPIVKH